MNRDYLSFIVKASKNMHDLIEDLLSYSRVNTNPKKTEAIPLPSLLNTIESEIHPLIADKQAQIHYQNLPPILTADKTQMRQLFQNLMVNAIKFSKPDVRPNIFIEGEETAQYWMFKVVDNGIGIQEAYFDKIFLLFKRLHTNRDFEGTGIGLALCKKIVERHQGKIWLASKEGVGTTFYFTIHKKGGLSNQSKKAIEALAVDGTNNGMLQN